MLSSSKTRGTTYGQGDSCLYVNICKNPPHRCKRLSEGRKGTNTISHALNSLLTKMDDVKKLKKGVLAYFKVCSANPEACVCPVSMFCVTGWYLSSKTRTVGASEVAP